MNNTPNMRGFSLATHSAAASQQGLVCATPAIAGTRRATSTRINDQSEYWLPISLIPSPDETLRGFLHQSLKQVRMSLEISQLSNLGGSDLCATCSGGPLPSRSSASDDRRTRASQSTHTFRCMRFRLSGAFESIRTLTITAQWLAQLKATRLEWRAPKCSKAGKDRQLSTMGSERKLLDREIATAREGNNPCIRWSMCWPEREAGVEIIGPQRRMISNQSDHFPPFSMNRAAYIARLCDVFRASIRFASGLCSLFLKHRFKSNWPALAPWLKNKLFARGALT